MIKKKILWWFVGGTIVVSIAIAVTINVVINNDKPATPEKSSCEELQQAIDKLGRPGIDLIPGDIKVAIRQQINDQNEACNVTGKDWSINHGKLQIHRGNTIIGNERSMLDDFK